MTKSTVGSTTLSSTANDASAQADGSLLTLLNDSVGLVGNVNIDDSITLKLGGVVPTGQYSLWVYFRNWDSLSLPVNFKFQGQGSNEVVLLDQDLGVTASSGGAYCVKYNFTATTNSVSMTVAGTQYGRSARIYATALQQISAPLVLPNISSQPVGLTNWSGTSSSMSVTANGTVPFRYQWYQNTTPLTGQTNSTLNFSSLSTNDTGSYTVIITNIAGAATSSVANVTIYDTVWPYSRQLSLVRLPASATDAASRISTNNTYVCALDFGSDTNTLSVNNVVFQQISLFGAGTGTTNLPIFTGVDSTYGGSWTMIGSNSASTSTGFGSVSSGGSDVTVQADGDMQALLADISYLPGTLPVGNYAKLTLGTLTPSAQYSLRYYYRQWNANDSPQRLVDFTFDGQGTNETLRVDLDAGGARCLEYDFTAASTSVDMTMKVASAGNGPHIYGVTLEQTAAAPVSPVLNVHLSGNNLTISWDISLTGYTLEGTSTLSPPNWQPVGGAVNNSITVNASTGMMFYHLKK